MMFSCERATALISESMDGKLSLYHRFALRMHLLMCKFCSRCWQQVFFLRNTMDKCCDRTEEIDFMPGHSLSEEACVRIKNYLKEQDKH